MDFNDEDQEEMISMMAEEEMSFSTNMMTTSMFYLTTVTLIIHYVFSGLLRSYETAVSQDWEDFCYKKDDESDEESETNPSDSKDEEEEEHPKKTKMSGLFQCKEKKKNEIKKTDDTNARVILRMARKRARTIARKSMTRMRPILGLAKKATLKPWRRARLAAKGRTRTRLTVRKSKNLEPPMKIQLLRVHAKRDLPV
mmetsp:Transcript_4856/g.10074  ORF Transcript_4856/g.10074 Transcript_4856/m.10074 type:complete len:198 (+) Transcript_4856:2344-2937(+)